MQPHIGVEPDGGLRVHLVNGLTLPVSRTFARAVREAGLGKGDDS